MIASTRLHSIRAAAVLVASLAVFSPAAAWAQTRPVTRPAPRPPRPAPHAGSIEVGGGFSWSGGFSLGTASADLIRNPTTGTGPFELFSSDTKLGQGVGLQGHVTGYLSTRFAIEGGLRYTRPVLSIDLSDDAEAAPDVTAEETLNRYVIDGSAVWHFGNVQRGRLVPFVSGGAGYLRELHEGNELIETGAEYHVTGGVKWWFSGQPSRMGIRAEGGVAIRDGGFDFREGRRTVPIAGVSLIYLF